MGAGSIASALIFNSLPGLPLSPAIAQPSTPHPNQLSAHNFAQESLAEHHVESDTSSTPGTSIPPSLEVEEVTLAPITVISTGMEPRQILQVRPTVNSQQESVMTLDIMGTMTAEGRTQPLAQLPTTEMVMKTDVVRLDEDGNRYIEFEYTEVTIGDTPGLPPEMNEAIQAQLSQLEGLSGRWVINEQGYISQFTMTPPETTLVTIRQNIQQMMDSLQQMSAPFPTEAIGVGAQWQRPYQMSMNGVDMSGVAIYELVSVEGDRITLNTAVIQEGTAATFSALPLPANVELSMQHMDSSGQGIIEMDLTEVMPIVSDMNLTSDSHFTIKVQDVEMPVSMNMLVNLSLISE